MTQGTYIERAPSREWARARAIGAKIISVLLTLFGLLALTFAIGRLVPADPVLLVIGDKADHETYMRVFKEMGLDRPVWEQFLAYASGMLQGNFGRSLFSGNQVVDDIKEVFPATAELAIVALLIAVSIGIPAGVASAVNEGKAIDNFIRVFGLIGYSAPSFWISLVGLMLFYGYLGWLPGPGRIDLIYDFIVPRQTGFLLIDTLLAGEFDAFQDVVRRLVMPAFILGYASAAYIARMTRSFMLEQLRQDYIIAAKIKGLSRSRVIWVHAFRSITVQLITVVVLVFAFQLEGSVLVETVFAWPGFGRYMVTAMLFGDMAPMLTCVTLIGVIFISLNLLADLLYRMVDPRTRS